MHRRFLLFYLDMLVDYSRVSLGAGINYDGYSIDGGQSWYLDIDGQLVPEEDFMLGNYAHNCLGCTAAKLS